MKICQYESCELKIADNRKRCPDHAKAHQQAQMREWHRKNHARKCKLNKDYNQDKKRGAYRRKSTFVRPPVIEKREYNRSDLMHLNAEKWPRVVGNIASGYYLFKP